ncbi:MAG TPA: hypothetical protein DG753_01350 [Clostridium sp.]|nr:hypothetical protein [Clostridium sp.]
MNSDKVINIKNIIVWCSLLGSIIVRIILNIIFSAPTIASTSLALTGAVTLGPIGLLILKKSNVKLVMYGLCLSMMSYIVVMVVTNPILANYLIIFYVMFVTVLYEDMRAIILCGSGSTLFIVYFFIKYKDQLFDNVDTIQNLPFLTIYIILGSIMFMILSYLMKKNLSVYAVGIQKK